MSAAYQRRVNRIASRIALNAFRMRGRSLVRICCLSLAVGLPGASPLYAQATPGQACDAAASAAEHAWGLPPGLLQAIGIVETGRRDAVLGRTAPWPWAIDVAGRPFFFSTLAEAEAALAALRASGQPGVDIGCFQVSLRYHLDAFASPEQGFDATENARVAGQLLHALYQQTGSWRVAAALYHSADPDRGPRYASRVMAAWYAAPDPPQPDRIIAGVRVITPGIPANAPEIIRLSSAGPLPVVFNARYSVQKKPTPVNRSLISLHFSDPAETPARSE